MILLALDTCDSRGSLAILRDAAVLTEKSHKGASDYSSWVLPSAAEALRSCGLRMVDIELFVVASGPGSFTGVRVGLTTVKAWSEVYGKPIAAVSRLEAIASQVAKEWKYAAAFVDAQRGQVFGGLYRRAEGGFLQEDREMVVDPREFLGWVEDHVRGESTAWISLDPEKITALERWAEHARKGERVQASAISLAPAIGKLGRRRVLEGSLTDPLKLDADYLRRSDAEIFWKGAAKGGS